MMSVRWRARRLLPAMILAALAAMPVRAADAPGQSGDASVLQWFGNHDYAQLDRYYADLQHRYESGHLSDIELLQDYQQLYAAQATQADVDAWVNAYPRSYAAHVVRGAWYYREARRVRGEDFIEETPVGQIAQMNQLLTKARSELESTAAMTAKPLMTALYLLNVEQLNGSRERVKYWMEAGDRIDPGNFVIRRRYMVALEPRWGGSYEQMRAFVDDSQKQGASPTTIAVLKAIILDDLGDTYWRAGDGKNRDMAFSAEVELLKALPALPTAAERWQYAQALYVLRRYDEALVAFEDMQRRGEGDGQIDSELGWIYSRHLHEEGKAWEAYRRGAQRGNANAQTAVGMTLYKGCPELALKPDHEAGLVWLRKAAAQGDKSAVDFLAQHSS